jgi:uroporphyrinogen-III synthase
MERNAPALSGISILVLKAPADSLPMIELGNALGAIVDAVPAIRIEQIPEGLSRITPTLINSSDQIILTSPIAATLLFENTSHFEFLRNHHYVVVGPATANALAARHVPPMNIAVPNHFNAATLIDELGSGFLNQTVLYPRSEAAHPALGQSLRRYAASVYEIPIYRPISMPIAVPDPNRYDYIVFTSGSIATSFFNQYPQPLRHPIPIVMGHNTADVVARYTSQWVTSATATQHGVIETIRELVKSQVK